MVSLFWLLVMGILATHRSNTNLARITKHAKRHIRHKKIRTV